MSHRTFANRITGTGEERPDDLLANPLNHRIHPREQIDALAGALREVGWVQQVIVNERTGHLIDGHARVTLALENNEPSIPVVYVDLTEHEERTVLAAYDAITALAGTDDAVLAQILDGLEVDDPDLRAFLDGLLAREAPPEDATEAARATLAEQFLVPPFSILDGRAGHWLERKRAWLQLGIKSELGRGDDLTFSASSQPPGVYDRKQAIEQRDGTRYSWSEFAERYPEELKLAGTSIFDPVLCELTYRWFAPPGGAVLDPFAGGSVRGVVAALLGYAYTGLDLSAEQVEANRTNWQAMSGKAPEQRARAIPALRVDAIEGIRVVRDDYVEGGTKRRVLQHLLRAHPAEEFVYATPAFGFAQVALAYAAADAGKRATVFTAHRKKLHRRTLAAQQAGARIETVPNGYLSNVTAKAKAYADEAGAHYLAFGVDNQDFIDGVAAIARGIDPAPTEVWTVAGSGVLTRALQQAWPDADVHAVRIGAAADTGRATVHQAPEKFEQPAQHPPPFPSCPEYDAKAWRFIKQHASPGALFWNVAGEASLESAEAATDAPRWIAADSLHMDEHLSADARFDLVFTCPPYGDLEVYSDDPRDISAMDYARFLETYRAIIARACARLKDDRFAVCVVGEIRGKAGAYRGFVPDTIAAFEAAGLRYYNEAVYITPTGSLALRAANYFRASRKLGKGHQQALVFAKGEPKLDTPEGLSEALTAAFADERTLLEAGRKVLVFAQGDPKAAAAALGEVAIDSGIDQWAVDASEVDR